MVENERTHTKTKTHREHGGRTQSLRLTLFILHKPQVSRKNAMQNKLSFPTCNLLLSTLFLYSFLSTRLLGAYGSSLKVQLEILSLSPIYSQHTVFKGPCTGLHCGHTTRCSKATSSPQVGPEENKALILILTPILSLDFDPDPKP